VKILENTRPFQRHFREKLVKRRECEKREEEQMKRKLKVKE
jgi:hypothetical protein